MSLLGFLRWLLSEAIRRRRTIYLCPEDVDFLISVASELFLPDETLALTLPHGGRDKLEGHLAQPQWDHFPTLQEKAAALTFYLIKGHPFNDGNKRFAIAATEVFIVLNGGALMVADDELREVCNRVAEKEPEGMTMGELCQFYRETIVMYRWSNRTFREWLDSLPEGRRGRMIATIVEWHRNPDFKPLFSRVPPAIISTFSAHFDNSKPMRLELLRNFMRDLYGFQIWTRIKIYLLIVLELRRRHRD